MRKTIILIVLMLALVLCGCEFSAPTAVSAPVTQTTAPETTPPAPAATAPDPEPPAPESSGKPGDDGIDSVISIKQLGAIMGVNNYQYSDLDEDCIGGRFWSVTSAMLTIEFRIHPDGGMDLLEDYRTVAKPESRVWLESPWWDSGIYYEIDDWTAEIVAVYGGACYGVTFVPSMYTEWGAPELGTALMELLISSVNGEAVLPETIGSDDSLIWKVPELLSIEGIAALTGIPSGEWEYDDTWWDDTPSYSITTYYIDEDPACRIVIIADRQSMVNSFESIEQRAVEGTVQTLENLGEWAFKAKFDNVDDAPVLYIGVVVEYEELVLQVLMAEDNWKAGYGIDAASTTQAIAAFLMDAIKKPY